MSERSGVVRDDAAPPTSSKAATATATAVARSAIATNDSIIYKAAHEQQRKRPTVVDPTALKGIVCAIDGYGPEERHAIAADIAAMGGVVEPRWSPCCHYLICETLTTTVKAVPDRSKVLVSEWVTACMESGKLVHPAAYTFDQHRTRKEQSVSGTKSPPSTKRGRTQTVEIFNADTESDDAQQVEQHTPPPPQRRKGNSHTEATAEPQEAVPDLPPEFLSDVAVSLWCSDAAERKKLQRHLNLAGATVAVSTFDAHQQPSEHHIVIAAAKGDESQARSAMASQRDRSAWRGATVVSSSWLSACVKEGRFVPPSRYARK